MAMSFTEMENTVRQAAGRDSTSAPDVDVDRAILRASRLFVQQTKCNPTVANLNMSAAISGVSFSGITNFQREQLIHLELGYKDRGTWSASGGTYSLYDLVIGDGSPDAFLYFVNVAHTSTTSKQPPLASFWTRIYSKIGFQVIAGPVGYRQIRRHLDNSKTTGEPKVFAWEDNVVAHFFPIPDAAYQLRVIYNDASANTASASVATVPEEYLNELLWLGAAATLDSPHPDARAFNPSWQQYTKEFIPWAKGRLRASTNVIVRRDPSSTVDTFFNQEGFTLPLA